METNQGGSKKGRPMSGQRWSSLDQGRMEGKVFSVSSLDLIKSFLSGTGGPQLPPATDDAGPREF